MKEANRLIVTIFSLLIVIAGSITVGFFIGRSTIDSKTKTGYVKGETIRDTVYIPAPYSEKKADRDNLIPIYIKDSEGKATIELDTTKSKEATIEDWNLERKYSDLVFNNENGKFLYDITVKNNKLSKFNYTFTPMQKISTTVKERIFQPYVSANYSTLDIVSIGGGFFYHNLGIEYQFQRDLKYNDTGHSFGLKYKF